MLHYVHLFLEAGIDDAQILTLTREDLNELFPGIRNFQLRRTIMTLITDTVKVMCLVKMLVTELNSKNICTLKSLLKEKEFHGIRQQNFKLGVIFLNNDL